MINFNKLSLTRWQFFDQQWKDPQATGKNVFHENKSLFNCRLLYTRERDKDLIGASLQNYFGWIDFWRYLKFAFSTKISVASWLNVPGLRLLSTLLHPSRLVRRRSVHRWATFLPLFRLADNDEKSRNSGGSGKIQAEKQFGLSFKWSQGWWWGETFFCDALTSCLAPVGPHTPHG